LEIPLFKAPIVNEEISDAAIRQAPGLVFRNVDGLYYVTNPNRHEVAVINHAAFCVLELSDGQPFEEVCRLFREGQTRAGGESTPAIHLAAEDVRRCLADLKAAKLIDY
jgi:hypothetical protein